MQSMGDRLKSRLLPQYVVDNKPNNFYSTFFKLVQNDYPQFCLNISEIVPPIANFWGSLLF